MKIRADFVTNSSSSSFIVIVDEEITCVEDLRKYLPNADDWQMDQIFCEMINTAPFPVDTSGFRSIQVKLLCGQYGFPVGVWSKTDEIQKLTQDLLALKCKNGISLHQCDQLEEQLDAAKIEHRNVTIEKIAKNSKPSYLYHATFSDEDGMEFSKLEHQIMPNSNFPFITKESHH